jgi:1-acyl-sn-glycerol-3-phosphate acyltransferase
MTIRTGAKASKVDRWGRDVSRPALGGIFEAASRSWFRVEWEGLENIPAEGGALLVSNHAGMMPVDGGLIQQGVEAETNRLVYMLAHHGFFSVPFVGQFMRRSGTVVAHPDNADRLLREDGRLVLVFPEGEKGPVKPVSERYRLQRFGRGGFVETAVRAGVPIIPIALMGTDDATPTIANFEIGGQTFPLTLNALLLGPILGTVLPLPVKIRARVLPRIDFPEAPGRSSYPRSQLMDHAEAIRGELQSALDEMYAARQSKWFG